MTLQGTFRIHGVSQETSIPATVVLLPDAVRVRGKTPLNLKAFKIRGLSKGLGMLRVQEEILVHLDLMFTTSPLAGSMARTPKSMTNRAPRFGSTDTVGCALVARHGDGDPTAADPGA